MKQKGLRATLTRWGDRLAKEQSLPLLLLGFREIEGGGDYTLCCVDAPPEQIADILRQVLGELERQIFEAACREGK